MSNRKTPDVERRRRPGADSAILDLRGTWSNPEKHDRTAAKMIVRSNANIAEFFDRVDERVRSAERAPTFPPRSGVNLRFAAVDGQPGGACFWKTRL
jgi:hypothetical protein